MSRCVTLSQSGPLSKLPSLQRHGASPDRNLESEWIRMHQNASECIRFPDASHLSISGLYQGTGALAVAMAWKNSQPTLPPWSKALIQRKCHILTCQLLSFLHKQTLDCQKPQSSLQIVTSRWSVAIMKGFLPFSPVSICRCHCHQQVPAPCWTFLWDCHWTPFDSFAAYIVNPLFPRYFGSKHEVKHPSDQRLFGTSAQVSSPVREVWGASPWCLPQRLRSLAVWVWIKEWIRFVSQSCPQAWSMMERFTKF